MLWSIVLLTVIYCVIIQEIDATLETAPRKHHGNSTDNSILGPYPISSITLSGLSSGAYMAVQVHMSHSNLISGVAAFAGGPFYCAEGTLDYAETKCMDGTFGGPNVVELIDLTEYDELYGYIDKTANLRDDKIFIYSGKSDTVVNGNVVRALQRYYEAFVPIASIITEYNVDSEHCIPTLDYGEQCSVLSSPYIGDCSYDGAGAALQAIFTDSLSNRVEVDGSNLFKFDQTPYIPKDKELSSIGDEGYIYVPTACQGGTQTCALHISFHGCLQTLSEIGNEYAVHSGFNEWAEMNNIIVLYPYAVPSTEIPYNPNGCWDWWGYTGALYGVKEGVQIEFTRNLIAAVTGR